MSYYQSSQYRYELPDQYVSPQQLLNMPPTLISVSDILQEPSSHPSSSNSCRKRIQDVGRLAPGAKHQLSHDPVPTAQSILDGSYSAALAKNKKEEDMVFYIPRLPEHTGVPSLKPIVFSVNGVPGPYLNDIMKQKVTLDNGAETIFNDHGWKKTAFIIDWPGVATTGETIFCFNNGNTPITRSEIAQIVASSAAGIISTGQTGKPLKWGPQIIDSRTRAWDLRKFNYRDVRLIAMNYYRKFWVPVLAIDVD